MPIVDTRYDPWAQTFSWQFLAEENQTSGALASIGKTGLQLNEAIRPPTGATPTTIEIWFRDAGNPPSFKGVQLNEVSGTPGPGEFRPDYGFFDALSGNPTGVASGKVWLNAADDAKDFVIDYYGWGSPLSKRVLESEFTATGSGGGPPVASLVWLPFKKTPSVNFPFLPAWEKTLLIDVANWPLLQPDLYDYVYDIDGVTAFAFTGYADNGGGKVRLTMDTTQPEVQPLLDSMFAEAVLNGNGTADFTNFIWIIEFTSTVGAINPGLYEILEVDIVTGYIDIDLNFPGGSGSGNVQARPFADPADGDNARWPGLSGLILRAPGGDVESLFSEIDQMQGHQHGVSFSASVVIGGSVVGGPGLQQLAGASISILDPTDDGTNGTPRTGDKTRDRTKSLYVYLAGGEYNP